MIPDRVQRVVELIDLFDIDVEEVWKSEGGSPLARQTFIRYWRFEITTQSGTFTVEVTDRLVRQSPRTAAAMVRRATVHVVPDVPDPHNRDANFLPFQIGGRVVSREEWLAGIKEGRDKTDAAYDARYFDEDGRRKETPL